MSVRVFSKNEFYDELKKAGFNPTEEKTEFFTIWENADGEAISVNHRHDYYPYYYLDDLLSCVGINYNSSGTVVDIRKYKISH